MCIPHFLLESCTVHNLKYRNETNNSVTKKRKNHVLPLNKNIPRKCKIFTQKSKQNEFSKKGERKERKKKKKKKTNNFPKSNSRPFQVVPMK